MSRLTLIVAFLVGFVGLCAAFPIEYNDSEVRQLFNLAAHTFSSKTITCVDKAYPDPVRKYRTFFHSATYVDQLSANVSVVVYVDKPTQNIVVAVGVFESEDENVLKGKLLYNDPVDFHDLGNVDKIFVDIVDLKWEMIRKHITTPSYAQYTVTFTGYSIGGAVATLAAMRTISHQHRVPSAVKLVTFGAPRVGDLTFASSVDREIQSVFRVTHRGDPVVQWPPCVQTSDLGCSLNAPEAPHHFGTEIFYDNDMSEGSSFTKCTNADEDPKCSDGKAKSPNFNDHLWYFQHKVISYGQNDCTDVAGAEPSGAGAAPITIASILITTVVGGVLVSVMG
uniref:Lipase_3 domain-containing protein n=1 Tax=Panagrellus redivivus TaxID=6233 RepID=A0A7E4VJU2_PANRE